MKIKRSELGDLTRALDALADVQGLSVAIAVNKNRMSAKTHVDEMNILLRGNDGKDDTPAIKEFKKSLAENYPKFCVQNQQTGALQLSKPVEWNEFVETLGKTNVEGMEYYNSDKERITKITGVSIDIDIEGITEGEIPENITANQLRMLSFMIVDNKPTVES